METVKLIAPASTSNLGPGFDTLGLAVDWYLMVQGRSGGAELKIVLPEEEEVQRHEAALRGLVEEAIKAWEERSGRSVEGLTLEFSGDVPLARGLGSSAAYRLAAVAAVNKLSGAPLDQTEILELVCQLEKHTDNAVPCAVGGLTVSGWEGNRVRYIRHKVASRFRLVALIPERLLSTEEARSALPTKVSRENAVFNLQRALWLVHALINDQSDDFSFAFQDRLHQPYREKLVPFLSAVIAASIKAGAFGAFLSGAGSAIIAITDQRRAEKVGKAMLSSLQAGGENGFVRTLKPDHLGLRFLEK